MIRSVVLIALVGLSNVLAFAPVQVARQSGSALQAAPNKDDLFGRKAAASFVAAAYLFASVATTTAPAFAFDGDFAGSSQILAARSGGRAGGRAVRPVAPPPSTTVYRSTTTYVQPIAPAPTIVVTPGYSYNPLPGLGLGLGLNAIDSTINTMRDIRQESEIQQSKAELQQARMKEAELEARLRQLELQQAAK